MSEEVLAVQSRRAARQRRLQIVQHAFAAIILVSAGAGHLSSHSGTALGIAEIGAGAVLIAAIVRERLHKREHGGVAWVELAGAGMSVVEVLEKARGRNHVSFLILLFLQPVVLLVFAVFDARIAAARTLRANDEALEVRMRLFLHHRVRWDDVHAFRRVGNGIEMELKNGGKRKLSLRDAVDRESALAWSAEQFRRRGIEESVAQ